MSSEKRLKLWGEAHFLAMSFFVVIVLGAILLRLPISTYSGISIVDAFFTSTTSVCVTGLTVVDVHSSFTFFGQIVILCLIQIGGLGIMTFAAFAVYLLRQKISLNDRMMLEYSFLQSASSFSLKDFIVFIVRYTFITEFIGAVCYFFTLPIDNIPQRIYYSIFHAVSAFCNAGISLYPDNLIQFSKSVPINLITASLIILGGIGFIVVFEIKNKFSFIIRRKVVRYRVYLFSLNTWIVLSITCSLIILGAAAIFFVQNISHGVNITILQAFFQSVSCRTAGFMTLDLGTLSHGTLLVMILLMFIGGSPGSCAGGIKTTTFAVLLFIVFIGRNNFEDVTARGRTIPKGIVYQALLVFLFSIIIVFVALVLLTIFQPNTSLIRLMFEAVSAFGTVGLSTGITASLTFKAKWILIATMFAGRVGSLTLFSIFMNRTPSNVKYAEERILIG